MTQEELQKLYESCLYKHDNDECEDLDYDKYDDTIIAAGGERFVAPWQDYCYDACHPEEDMIKFMKKHGFTVLDDPWCADEMTEINGWVVFPPKFTISSNNDSPCPITVG